MARHNKSRYAVLGFLSWRPASGYDLRKHIDESIGNFWTESYGQIYPALRELEREGLAHRTVERTEGRPDRHVYTITDAGRRELRRWLEQPCDPHVYRVEVMIKLFFGEQAGLGSSLAHLARYRDEHAALIERYEAIREHLLRDFPGDPRLPFWMLTVDCGVRVGRAYIEWCDQSEAVLRELAAAERIGAAAARMEITGDEDSSTEPARSVSRRGGGRPKSKGGWR